MSNSPATGSRSAQGSAEPAGSTAARLYLATARLLRSVRRPDPGGLGNGTLSALATLARSGPLRLGDLAEAEQVAASTMSRLVTALITAGYASTSQDSTDRRARLIHTTPEGQRFVTDRHTASITELRDRYHELTPEQQATVQHALPILESLVEPTGQDAKQP